MQHTCNPEKPNDEHQLCSTHRIVRQVRIAVITIISANKKPTPTQKRKKNKKPHFQKTLKWAREKEKGQKWNRKKTWERRGERERENHFSWTKTYRILSSPHICAGRRNMKTGTNYNQHEGLGNEKYIPRHVDNRRLLNAAIGASGFEPVEKMRSEVVERRTKRRRNTHTHTTHTSDCLSHT